MDETGIRKERIAALGPEAEKLCPCGEPALDFYFSARPAAKRYALEVEVRRLNQVSGQGAEF